MSSPTELRDLALELADIADATAMKYFGDPVPAVSKPDGTPVTEADRAIEAALRERVASALPDASVFGEEQGGDIVTDGVCLIVDPIDGTKNFMRGIGVFATLIGVLLDGQLVAGVASAPAMGERWDAATGAGARRNAGLGTAPGAEGDFFWAAGRAPQPPREAAASRGDPRGGTSAAPDGGALRGWGGGRGCDQRPAARPRRARGRSARLRASR